MPQNTQRTRTFFQPRWWRALPAVAFVAAVAVGTVGVGSAAAANSGIVSDDFNTATINTSTWAFVNPAGTATDSDNGTEAVITVPSGASQYASTSEAAPALVQNVTNGDFSAEVKFDSEVTQADQEQGLIAVQDSTDFIRFDIESTGAQAYVSAQATIGGVLTTESQLAVRNGTNFYLRVARSGNTWSYSYSYDGQAWTSEGSFTQALTLAQVGPYAASGPPGSASAPGFTALVDYFHNIASAVYTSAPTITLWYGNNETFGQEGEPQVFVNVLGNVSDPAGMASLSYTLNGGTSSALEMGENDYRLSSPGDFNAEIPYASLNVGANTVVITATDLAGNTSTQTVTVNDDYTDQSWPGNYSVNWSSAPSINSVAQVVDGDWAIQGANVRTLQTGYDRLIDIGDMNNWSQYQVTVPVTINALPPVGGAFGVGPIFGWQGHTSSGDGQQPPDGHPFDAWFNYADNGPGNPDSLSIYANSPNHHEQSLAQDLTGMQLTVGTTYDFEMQATTNPGGTTSQYSFKVWQEGTTEPANWLVQANGDLNQGSLLLASYWADVSYGPVTVTSLAPAPTPPVPAGTVLGGWKVVQSSYTQAYSPTTSQTVTATLPAGTTAGDDVVVVLAGATSGAAPTLAPADGLVALAGYPGPTQAGKYYPLTEVFVANDVPAGETSFAVTVSNGPSWGQYETALALEVSGPAIALDASASVTGTGTTTSLTTPSLTPAGANEMAITIGSWDNNPTSATGPTGWTAAPDLTAPWPVANYFGSPASGTAFTSTESWSPAGSYDSTLTLVTLRSGTGGPPPGPVPAGTVLGGWKVVQSSYTQAYSPGTSQTVTATLPAGTTAGDDVVVVLAGATSGAAPTLAPADGLVALAGYPGPTQAGKYYPLTEVFVANDVPAGETSFAVTVSNGPSWGQYETALALEVSGPAIALDASASVTGTGTTTSLTTPSLTPAGANEMAITIGSWDNNPTSATGPTGWTAAPDLTAPWPVANYFGSPASGTAFTSTESWSPAGSYDSTLTLVTLRSGTGGPPPGPVPAGTVLGGWKVVQSSYTQAYSPGTSQTVTATLPAGTTAGDDVVVVLAGATSGAAPTLAPADGLVALAGYPGPTQAGKYYPLTEVFVANDVPAGETSFAVTVSNGPSWGQYETALALEVSGPAIALDASASVTGTGTTTSLTTPSLTPAGANEMAITIGSWDNNPTSATGPTGWTAAPDLTAPWPVANYFGSPASGTAFTSTESWSPAGSYDSTLTLVTLK